MTLQDYQRSEWTREGYEYRTVDQDGKVFYHATIPVFVRDGYWISAHIFYDTQHDDCWAHVNCKHTLQSRDQWLELTSER
jgi:hypothetical protein